jgi:S-methylmethionine-dependent homocysteine/selenocysteine methylase
MIMAKYRHNLPQLANALFLTDGGLETTLLFQEGFDLPEFAATYTTMACNYQVGLILESATWRANPDWASKLGYDRETLASMNRKAIDLLHNIRQTDETETTPMVISGCVGPRGDGYVPADAMTVEEATAYHRPQIEVFRDADADLVTAMSKKRSGLLSPHKLLECLSSFPLP